MEEYQGLDSDLYTQTPSTSATYITFDKPYKPNAVAIIANCNGQPVFVAALTSATAISFPSSASTPVQGKVIPPNSVLSFPIPDDTTVLGFILEAAGTGKVFVSVQSGGKI